LKDKNPVLNKLVRFSLVGAVGTGLDITVFSLALLLGFGPAVSRAMGYTFGTLWAFFLNRRWVFNSQTRFSRFIPFSLTYLFSGFIVVFIQSLGPEGTEFNGGVFLAFGISVAIGALINFLLLRYLVFRD
jgi:putative flippase GtrA